VRIVVGETNSAVWPGTKQTAVDNALYLADDELTLLEHGASAVDWWALHNGGPANDVDLGLLSSGETLDRGPGAQPTDVPFAPYYGQQLTGELARAGSELLAVDSGDAAVVGHAARRPDGTLVVLLLNEDANAAHRIDLRVPGYQVPQGGCRLFYGPGSTAVTRSWEPVTGVRSLPANSLTELEFRPLRLSAWWGGWGPRFARGAPRFDRGGQPVNLATTLVKSQGCWSMPPHASASVPLPQGRSRFTDQKLNRARWCCWA
jgi:hypothetical protein